MRTILKTTAAVLVAAWLVSGAVGPVVVAQGKMVTFYLCLLVTPPSPAAPPADMAQLQRDHLSHLQGVMAGGKGVIAGPIAGDGRLRGILVMRVGPAEEAKAMADADPAVKAGQLAVEIHPWYVSKGALP